MKRCSNRLSKRNPSPRLGVTLIELVMSVAMSTVILAGIMSTLYIAMKGAETNDATMNALEGSWILEQITSEVQTALYFKEREANSLEFVAVDQDGDSAPDTIHYSWSGTAGDSLTRQFNNETAVVIAEDVDALSFTYSTQATSDPIRVMLVMGNAGSPSSQDAAKQSQFEAWGYQVIPVDDGASQATYDDAISQAAVAYVSEEANQNANGVAQKLYEASIGILNEELAAHNDFKMSSSNGTELTATSIDIVNTSHYITQPFSLGALTICSSTRLVRMRNTHASGLVELAEANNSSQPALAILDYKATERGGGKASGRRVILPWGGGSFDFNALNNDALTILQRSIDWAAGDNELLGISMSLQVGSDSESLVETQAEVLNRTRVTGP